MTLYLSCRQLKKSYGPKTLFQDLALSVFAGDQIGLIGPNGSGKSTLLKILADLESADEGEISMKKGLQIRYVPQTCDFPAQSLQAVLFTALTEESYPWEEKERLVSTWLSKMNLADKHCLASELSGGQKKRLAIACALIGRCDLLLLDEPTNHLDLEGILWLEKFLRKEAPTYILITHDRYFLQHTASKIIELDTLYPQGMFAIDSKYEEFLLRKEEFMKAQIEQQRRVASKARKELDWLSRSPKARTTKSKARVEDAHALLQELGAVKQRNTLKRATVDFSASERETRKLLAAKNLAKSVGGKLLFKNLDLLLSPGTRLGLMGPNGSGKTTLLKILGGELAPDMGTIKQIEGLQIVYFDQHRKALDDHLTLKEALSPNGDYVDFRGTKIHVNGWCKRFLFAPDLLNMPIGKLSGGERARISIAHLMQIKADILLLDEPTNDLDIPTLEVLEESLIDFPGAVVLITHDRCMLDRIATGFLALGDLENTQIYAEYAQWEKAAQLTYKPVPAEKPKQEVKPKAKLSYHEKKEYEGMEAAILALEEKIKALNHDLCLVADNPQKLSLLCQEIGLAETQLERHYLRWEELEKKLSSN